jgi:hypothetical protein
VHYIYYKGIKIYLDNIKVKIGDFSNSDVKNGNEYTKVYPIPYRAYESIIHG